MVAGAAADTEENAPRGEHVFESRIGRTRR